MKGHQSVPSYSLNISFSKLSSSSTYYLIVKADLGDSQATFPSTKVMSTSSFIVSNYSESIVRISLFKTTKLANLLGSIEPLMF